MSGQGHCAVIDDDSDEFDFTFLFSEPYCDPRNVEDWLRFVIDTLAKDQDLLLLGPYEAVRVDMTTVKVHISLDERHTDDLLWNAAGKSGTLIKQADLKPLDEDPSTDEQWTFVPRERHLRPMSRQARIARGEVWNDKASKWVPAMD